MQKTGTERVLTGSDFVADPGTMPTQVVSGPADDRGADVPDASPPVAGVRTITGAEASEGMLDVVATPERPAVNTSATPSGDSVLIDQKVGEINGRPVRVRDIFDEVGQRLATTARTKRLSAREWQFITGKIDPKAEMRTLTREQWMHYAGLVCAASLNQLLQDELLEAEARASLKPQQKQGLSWLVQEASEDRRRKSAGSRAAAQRSLEENGMTEQQWMREHESKLLIGFQLEERIRRHVRVSWKDVRLFYERNTELYNPPPTARFRLIRVPAADGAAVAAVQNALEGGEPFEKVASAAPNTFHPEEGGFLGDRTFTGPFAEADFNLPPALQTAARGLTAGTFTKSPVDLRTEKAWLYLETVKQVSRPLSDQDVQLEILLRLTRDAEGAEKDNYINKLKERASFSDLDAMVRTLVEAAAERYWPKG